MKDALQNILMALMTIAFPASLVFEILQILGGTKDGSIAADLFYLVTWVIFMGILAWLSQRADSPYDGDVPTITPSKRTQAMRFLGEALKHRVNGTPGDPGAGALHS